MREVEMMRQPDHASTVWTVAASPIHPPQPPIEPPPGSHHDTSSSSFLTELTPMAERLPHKKLRRRGLVLTEHGWQKLLYARVLSNEFGDRYTLDALGKKASLDPRTIGRIISRDVGVDKRTLQIFFDAFNVSLTVEDYTTPDPAAPKAQKTKEPSGVPAAIEPHRYIEELPQFKQKMIENCQCLAALLNLDTTGQATLTITLARPNLPQLELSFRRSG